MTQRLIYSLSEDAPRGVTWHGPFLNHSGYGEEMRGFVTALRHRGEKITVAPVATSARYLKSLSAERVVQFEAALSEPAVDHAVQLLHLPPHVLRRLPDAGPHVARSMFETDGLPVGWAECLNRMDEVWVPAAFNVETFRRAGVTVPLRVVPGGVDADVYRPGVAPLQIEGLSGTVFLSVFEWSFRKGWDVLLRAWADAFDHRDDVTLLLRAYPQQDFEGQRPADEIERRINTFLKKVGKSRRRVAPIVVLQEMVSDADMPALYARADAYVSPTRGEGSGRPFLEALSAGLPVLATRWSGHLEFLHDDNSLLIDIEGTEPIDQRQELAFYRGQRWASPSVRHLTQLLRSVVEDPAAAAARAARGRQDVLQRFTWEKVGELAAEHLDAIQKKQRPERTRREEAPAVRWIGDQWGQHSLSRVNREWCSRLASSGRVELEVMSYEQPKVERGAPSLRALEEATGPVLQRPADVVVRHQWPPDWTAPQDGAWVVVQPWEFGGLPDSWVPALRDEVDEVWCYTSYVRDVYARSGIPAEKLKIVPCGVDTGLFRPDGSTYPLSTAKTTKLLFVGGTIARKGIDVLLSTYSATFRPSDDVCLVIKSTGARDSYQGSAIDEQIRVLAADPLLPSIELIDDELSDEQMAALYRSCDLLVHPYRGEGFALPVAEAMASGLPVVVTAVGATADFCDDSNAYLVPATEVMVTVNDAGPSAAGYVCADPDADALSRALVQAVADVAGRRAKAARARQRIVSDFSWESAATLIAERCSVLARSVPTRFVPRQRSADSAFALDAAPERALLLDGDWQGGEVDQAVRLFAQAWRPSRPVTLVLRVPGQLHAAADRVESALREAGVDLDADADGPDILLVDNVEDDQRLDDLYSSVARVLRTVDATSVARAARVGTAVVTADDLPSWTDLLEGLTA